jgi:hypothetical protein
MDLQTASEFSLDCGRSKRVVVEPSSAQVSSDGGLLPFRQLDEQLRLTEQFAAVLTDRRDANRIGHSFLEMVRMRVYGILADYPDQNDHDVLRSDPIFKLICNRSIDAPDLASQPTLSRFENAIDVPCFFRLDELLVDQFIDSFGQPPRHLTLDLDAFDDPTHGEQQLTFFHGYYDQYQYLPRVMTCAENDRVLNACLLYGRSHPALAADDDLEKVIRRLRQAWPGLQLHVRADSGFGVPRMYEACERLDVHYTIGMGMNPRLKRLSENTLKTAVERFEATGQPQRLFCAFWYRAESWPAQRWVIVKCEANAQGTNRRAVVTNRPGAFVLPEAAYDEYTNRGESENRNKELKDGLEADRLSDHRYFANLFRLHLHIAAYHLLVAMRTAVADPPSVVPPSSGDQKDGLPTEALPGRRRRAWHNRRREHDPLGEGQPCTWRTRLIKVAATVRETTRRVIVQLSSSWPYLNHYRRVVEQLVAGAGPAFDTG